MPALAHGAYARALWPDPHTVAGARLRPMTLGHALLLQRLGCPWIPGAAREPDPLAPGFGDLLLAAFVCSRPWPRAAAAALAPRARRLRLWLWWKARAHFHAEAAALEAWSAYLAAQWPEPRVWKAADRKSGTRGADLLHLLLLTQRAHIGCPIREALDTPVARAVWDFFAWWEEQGALQLWSAEDARRAALLDAHPAPRH